VKPTEPDLSGRRLGRYRLVRRLGNGGMGVVYEATHEQLGTRSAIKILRRHHAKRLDCRERFVREAQAASAILHPNVVAIHDFGESPEGWPYYVMEFLEGHDLRVHLRNHGPLPWSRVQPLIRQAIDALSAAHRRGILHRDIKPANCFVVGDLPSDQGAAVLKLLDFGIARIVPSNEPRLTLDGQVLGTPAYMAPEVALGGEASVQSDLYSLAVTIHKATTGMLPDVGGRVSPRVPPELAAALVRALSLDPRARFETMETFARAMWSGTSTGRWAQPGPRTRRAAPGPIPSSAAAVPSDRSHAWPGSAPRLSARELADPPSGPSWEMSASWETREETRAPGHPTVLPTVERRRLATGLGLLVGGALATLFTALLVTWMIVRAT